MKERLLREWIKECLLLENTLSISAGAAGSASVEVPGTPTNVDIAQIAQDAFEAEGTAGVQPILVFNELVYDITVEAGNKNAWQAIAEDMLKFWGYQVPDQMTSGITVFYDVEKDGVYYSVKSSFKGSSNFAAATQSSSPKIESVLAFIIKGPKGADLGNIGCIKTGGDDDPVIRWGEVTAPISRDAVIQNISNVIKDPTLLQDFQAATAEIPPQVDGLIKKIKAHIVGELGMADGRLNTANMQKILGPVTGTEIASLALADPDKLFADTVGSAADVAAGTFKHTPEGDVYVATDEERESFLQRMSAVTRGLSKDELNDVIASAISKLNISADTAERQDEIRRFSKPTQKYINEYFLMKNFIKESLMREELTKADVERIAKQHVEKEIKKQLKDTVSDEVQRAFQDSATKDQMADISKKILKKFYREISYSYSPYIDRIKL